MKPLLFIAALVALSFDFAAPAHAKTLTCNVSNAGASAGWIAETISIEYDDGSDFALVTDRILLKNGMGTAIGQVKSDNAKRTVFVWDHRVTLHSQQNVPMQSRLTFDKKSQQMRMQAKALSLGQSKSGKGRCGF